MGFFDRDNSTDDGPPPAGYFIVGADNNEYGPYTGIQIRQYIAEHRILPSTPIRQGNGDWKTVSDLSEFRAAPSVSAPPVARKQSDSGSKKKRTKPSKKSYTPPEAANTIVIEYLNYAGDLKQFIGDPKSIRRRGNHFSVRVAPTFKRISLNRSKTRILKGVQAPAQLPAEPLPVQTTTSDTSIIQYTNWQGVQKEFKIITGVVDDKGDFVRVRVSPTFQYITLKRTRIGNPEALTEKTPGQEPATPYEAQPEPQPEPTPQPIVEEPAPATSGQVSVILTGCGLGTYDATKIIQELRPELGTFDTYQLLRNFPQTIAENIDRAKAEEFKQRLENAGCTVEIR